MLKDIRLIIDDISKDMESIANFIKNISTCIYEKEVIFYNEDINKWYSRIHCDYLTLDEVLVWLEEDIRTIHEKSLK